MGIIYHTYGDHATEIMIDKVARRGEDVRPILNVVGDEMLAAEKELFLTSGASAGAPWRPLMPSTIKRKKGDARPLIRTGDEMRSLSQKEHPDNILNVTRGFVIIGSRKPQVPLQRTGTREMKPREPITFSLQKQQHWIRMIGDFVLKGEINA